ncbi:MAG: dipicolinate synthase subunit B [Candidatus Syntrophonatronum acetioxidans]|uniref:Dipicolinate synthase subunit B n=1 Tax=Candidatus Syntrophonatronum acetioxidans TaxID=1795816 RepID=A0A424YDT0_9FIRM|nr:MAG: dipicolinate synthase subunit B [Candidatus Syntrophonatronum acetioxidans]
MLKGLNIGIGITGSHCTFDKLIPEMVKMVEMGANLYPVISPSVSSTDTRFGRAEIWKKKFTEITKRPLIESISGAEPVGPESFLDVMVIAPCTGNTLAKLANGITDTSILMAAKAQLRNLKPVVLAVSTNDGLGINARNIGILINTKNIFLVPFGQDNPLEKANSVVSKIELIIPTIIECLEGRQIQPVLIEYQPSSSKRLKEVNSDG